MRDFFLVLDSQHKLVRIKIKFIFRVATKVYVGRVAAKVYVGKIIY